MERQLKGPVVVKLPAIPDVAGLGGAIAGLLAGLAMVIASPILSLMTGIGLWEPVKLIATVFFPRTIMNTPGFMLGPVLVGTAIHFVMSALLGIIFGLIFNRLLHMTTAFGMSIQLGLVYGILIWIFLYVAVLPFIAPALRESYQPPFAAQNILFGIVLGIAYGAVRPLPYHYKD